MTTIEIARGLAAHQQVDDAQKAYSLVLQQADGTEPALELEAASYIFDSGGNYKVAYTTFHSLYNRGLFQSELFDLMVRAFYAPNIKEQERQYLKNCRLLGKYPYLFRKDFPAFDDLPVKFFPFDDDGFLPFFTRENRFGDYVNVNDTVIDRNFFKDLENPILATDVFSQYQLEYLRDNVRRSDWVGRENHIYLHYADWDVFCSYLQCLDFKELLRNEKLVFLIEDEEKLYPIDFKERFGIDYSQYTVKPFAITEVVRLIWHTQLATHNGSDFFNEIFYGHPNLLAIESIIFSAVQKLVAEFREAMKGTIQGNRSDEALQHLIDSNPTYAPGVFRRLSRMKEPTDKDLLVGLFMGSEQCTKCLDLNSRIAPALLFQPHFYNILYRLSTDEENRAVLDSKEYDEIKNSPIFQNFKYIKTFTPMRRITTSYAATVKFMQEAKDEDEDEDVLTVGTDVISQRLLNRSFMINWQDRLYRDSVLVRFEDGKLNPKATFTALAAFLDIPYTQSMTYCSGRSGLNPESLPGNALGFDTSRIYYKYDKYANDAERTFLEYFLRDAYEFYGYDLEYYDGTPMDEARVEELLAGFTTLDRFIGESWRTAVRKSFYRLSREVPPTEEEVDRGVDEVVIASLVAIAKNRKVVAQTLMQHLNFINRAGQPLRMMPLLQLDPALLEAPVYH